jgi:protein involved in polysaccharide export with SLBB domain
MNRLASIRAITVLGCISALLGLSAVLQAAEPPSGITQSNAVATASNPEVPTNAMPNAAQPATNGLEAPPITNTAAAATHLSQPATTNAAFVLDDKHKLAVGDVLSFRIVEDGDDPNENPRDVRKPAFFVTDSGDLEVPYIGRVPAENKTCRQLAAEIKAALEKEYYYQATVIIAVDVMTKATHGRVYLVGAVRLQGAVEMPGDESLTLSKAILRAGGFTDYADRRHVKVTRKGDSVKDAVDMDDLAKTATNKPAAGKETTGKRATAKDATGKDDKKSFVVDVGEIFDKGKIETDLTLEAGDLIYVPDRLIRF